MMTKLSTEPNYNDKKIEVNDIFLILNDDLSFYLKNLNKI